LFWKLVNEADAWLTYGYMIYIMNKGAPIVVFPLNQWQLIIVLQAFTLIVRGKAKKERAPQL